MTEAELRSAIFGVLHRIAPEADLQSLDPHEDLLRALDIDSFDFLNLLIGLHERLDVDIPESDYGRVRSLHALLEYLSTKGTSHG